MTRCKLQCQRDVGNTRQTGSVMVESTLALFLFVIMLLFMLFFYEYIERKHEVQLKAGEITRQTTLGAAGSCYKAYQVNVNEYVSLQYKIQRFIGVGGARVETTKRGHAGPCPRMRQSRFDYSQYRRPRSPGGGYIGSW